jgi:hypothetical protein
VYNFISVNNITFFDFDETYVLYFICFTLIDQWRQSVTTIIIELMVILNYYYWCRWIKWTTWILFIDVLLNVYQLCFSLLFFVNSSHIYYITIFSSQRHLSVTKINLLFKYLSGFWRNPKAIVCCRDNNSSSFILFSMFYFMQDCLKKGKSI